MISSIPLALYDFNETESASFLSSTDINREQNLFINPRSELDLNPFSSVVGFNISRGTDYDGAFFKLDALSGPEHYIQTQPFVVIPRRKYENEANMLHLISS